MSTSYGIRKKPHNIPCSGCHYDGCCTWQPYYNDQCPARQPAPERIDEHEQYLNSLNNSLLDPRD